MQNRRHFIVSLAGTAAATWIGLAMPAEASAAGTTSAPKPLPDTVTPPGIPTVQVQSPDSVNIGWAVSGLCSGWVEYGPGEQLGKVARGAQLGRCPVENDVIRIPLAGLRPGETVHYRTVTAPLAMPANYALKAGEAIVSPTHSFVMPGSEAKSVRLAVWNDVHEQAKTLVALRAATEACAPDMLVLNGDFVRGNFQTENTMAEVFLREKTGVATSRWPVLFTRGNHEGYGPKANHLPRFVPPQHEDGYYQFLRLGPLALLLLDTGTDKEDDARILHGTGAYGPYRELQREWLERVIEDPRFTSAPFRVLCCHIPLRWRPDETNPDCHCADGDRRWSPLLAKGKVQAVISGHTHEFWHSEPTPERPFHQITGGGPEIHESHWSPTPATVTEITVDEHGLRVRVAEASSGKELLNLTLGPVA